MASPRHPTNSCTTCWGLGHCWPRPARAILDARGRCDGSPARGVWRSTSVPWTVGDAAADRRDAHVARAPPGSSTSPPCPSGPGRGGERPGGRLLAPGAGRHPHADGGRLHQPGTTSSAPTATSSSTRPRTSRPCSCAWWPAARCRARSPWWATSARPPAPGPPPAGTRSPPICPGQRPPRLVELTVSYRTPAEVVEVAARVLAETAPGLAPAAPGAAIGEMPRFVGASRAGLAEPVARPPAEAVADVSPGPVAVLGPAVLVADLARRPRRRRGPRHRPPAADGLGAALVLLPVDLANGLEFDAVVVVEPAWWPRRRASPARARRWRRHGDCGPSTWR